MTTLSPPSGENMKGIYILWGLFILEMYKHTDTLDHQCSQIVLQDRLRTFSNLFVSSLLTEIMFGQGTVCLYVGPRNPDGKLTSIIPLCCLDKKFASAYSRTAAKTNALLVEEGL